MGGQPWASGLLRSVQSAFTRLVREPMEAAHLAQDIPDGEGPVCNVSVAVREQYEESPYPRWFSLQPRPHRPSSLPSWLHPAAASPQRLAKRIATVVEPLPIARWTRAAGRQAGNNESSARSSSASFDALPLVFTLTWSRNRVYPWQNVAVCSWSDHWPCWTKPQTEKLLKLRLLLRSAF